MGVTDPTRPAAARTRVRGSRRVAAAVLGAVAAAVLLGGCATGFNAEALKPYDPADGVNVHFGQIWVSDALVVAPPEGGGDGVVVMSIANQGNAEDQLVSISTDAGQVETNPPAALVPEQSLLLSSDTTPSYTIRGLTAKPGQIITLQLTFARAGVLTLHTVIVPATGYYASITPAPAPAATPTGTASPGATSPGATASPGGTASPATPAGTTSPAATPTG